MVSIYTTIAVAIKTATAMRCPEHCYKLLVLVNCVANSEAVTTLSATTSEDLAAIGCCHAVTETMLVSFLSV